MKAVIDRYEGDYAILLFGDDETKVNIPKVLLPKGSGEGSWLKITIEHDHTGTANQTKKTELLLNKLKNKPRE